MSAKDKGKELALVPEETAVENSATGRRSRLPGRILVQCSVRTQGASAGHKDWLYTDLKTGKKYRSMIAVDRALAKENQRTEPISNTAPTPEAVAEGAHQTQAEDFIQQLEGQRTKRRRRGSRRPPDDDEELPVGFV